MSVLGLDLGTSGVRASVFDTAGSLIISHSLSTTLLMDGDLAETDPLEIKEAVLRVVRLAAEEARDKGDPVLGISFSTQGEAVLPVTGALEPLALMPVSMDGRGSKASKGIESRFGDSAYRDATGQPLHPMFSIFKIAAGLPGWDSGAATYYLTLDSFISSILGVETPTTDYSMAARTGAFDVDSLVWSQVILDEASEVAGYRLHESMLPRAVEPGTVIGHVSDEGAALSGLDVGTAIVAGMHDQAAAYFGGGGSPEKVSTFSLGSSDCLTVSTRGRPDLPGEHGFASYPTAKGIWITLAGTAAGGWSLSWIANLLDTDVSTLLEDLGETPAELLVLPYLAGSGTLDNDPFAQGVILGLTLSTSAKDLGKAFVESAGYELAKIADAFERLGVEVGKVNAVGTGAANLESSQLRANAAGRPLRVVGPHASARGAALFAGIGIGLYESACALPEVGVVKTLEPSASSKTWYKNQRHRYQETFVATHALMLPQIKKQ